MGGIKSTSSRRARASTAIAGQAVVINNGGGVLGVAGAVVSANTSITLDVVTPGQTSANSAVNVSSGPTIGNIQYLDANNQPVSGQVAVNTAGGNILINGTGFVANSSVYVNNSLVSNTFIGTTQIRAVIPAGNVGNVALAIFTPTNTGFLGPNVRYSGAPSWTTSALSSNNGSPVSTQLVATGDSTLTYSLGAGSLPTGLSLSSSGLITGTVTGYTQTTVVTFTVTATDQEGQQTQQIINYTVVVGDAFIAYVPMLLSGEAPSAQPFIVDASLNNFSLTVVGDTRPTNRIPFASNPGTYGSAYFDGTGDYITFPQSGAFNLGTSNFTIEAWVYFSTVSGTTPIIALDTTSYPAVLIQNEAGTLKAYATSASVSWDILNGATFGSVVANQWYHVALTRSGSSFRTFLNGTLVTTVTSATAIEAQGNAGRIGGSDQAANLLTGYVSNLRIVKGTAVYTANFTPSTTPLTATADTVLLTLQTNQPPNNNSILDTSTNYHLVTRTNNATSGTLSPYGENWSYYFDGSGTTTTLPTVRTPTNSGFVLYGSTGTFECWVYPTGYSTGALPQGGSILISIHWGSGERYNALGIDGNGVLQIIKDGGGYISNSSSTTIARNTWTHIAWTYTGSTNRFWVNGTEITNQFSNPTLTGTFPFNTTGTPFATLGTTFYNGTSYTYLSPFIGYMSNVRFVKGSQIYTGNFTPSTAPLQPVAGTVLLTAQDPRFIDRSINNFSFTLVGTVGTQKFGLIPGTSNPNPAYSVYFDGSGDSYNITSNQTDFAFGTGDFTIEFWTYLNNIGGYGFFYDSRPAASQNNSVAFFHQPNSGVITLIVGTNEVAATANGAIAAGAWYHVALCRSSGSTRFFINGVQSGSTYSDGNDYTNAANRPIIGTDKDNQFYINGYMSNLRVVKGTALYTSTFTPSTSPLTAVSGTSLLVNTNTIADTSTLADTISVSGNTTPVVFNPFTPTFTTQQSYSKSVFGGSMYFDGNGDYYTVPDSATLELGSSAFTIECWIWPNSLKGYQAIASKPGATDANGWILGFETNNTLSFYAGNGTWAVSMTGAATPRASTWNHVAVTRTGNVWRLYLNGVQANTVTNALSINDLSFPLYVGWYPNFPSSASTQAFGGYISDFRVIKGTALYTAPFVPPELPLTAIANTSLLLPGGDGAVANSTMLFDLETAADAKEVNDGPYFGSYYSNYFDGTGDYFTVPANAAFSFGTGDFTVEFWAYTPTFSNTNGKMILDSRPAGTNGSYWWMGINNAGAMQFRTLSSGGTILTDTSTRFNQWNHYAVTRSGTTLRMFVNGTQTTSAAGNSDNISSSGLFIGANAFFSVASDTFYLGWLSNIRIVKGTALYTDTFTPSTTPLTAVANTSLLTCQSNSFKDNSSNNFTLTKNGDIRVTSVDPWQNNLGASYLFDGAGDYVIAPYSPTMSITNKNWTMEMWVYPTAQPAGNYACLIAAGGSGYSWAAGSGYQYFMQLDPDRKIFFQYYVSNNVNANLTSAGALTLGAWSHVAVTYSGTTLRIFINGVQSASTTVTLAANTGMTTVALGGAGPVNNGNYLSGYLSDVRFTSGVARYTEAFTPPTSAFQTK